MSELFADSYPSRWERRCGMHPWTVVGAIAVAVLVVLGVLSLLGRTGRG